MKVIKQLQIKFVFSIIFIEMVVFAGILLCLNFTITNRMKNEARDFLIFLTNNNGHRPRPKPLADSTIIENFHNPELLSDIDATSSASREHPEAFLHGITDVFRLERATKNNLRNYFSVKVTEDGSVIDLIQDFPLNYTDEEIKSLVNAILEKDKKIDSVGGVMFCIKDLRNGHRLISMVNRNSEIQTLSQLYLYSSLLYLLSIIVSVVISIPISRYMIKPAEDAFEKQKQFIADASHELKTPIAVIGANIDVLEGEIKNNKWLEYIKAENKRMGELVKDLLYLAKNDAGRNDLTFSDFDFSNAVENSVLPFEVVAFEANKTLEFNIEKQIVCNGDEKSLKQVFIILVDNALKNSEEGAKISVKAYAEGQKIIYKVHNTGAGIPKDELEKIFLRFYRSDSSRVRKTGGSGLGLSIARAIAQDHGGTLTADSEVGKWAEFTLTIPRKK
ncbi:MAG: HAMP domain-containing histidine kinase [Treponema sp.]|nr:HAMP domain-containing histidine kinase [Treponema sp.]